MSNVKISQNVFLGVQEQNRITDFILNASKDILKNSIKNFGIVVNDSNDNFSVIPISNNQIRVNPGIGFDKNINKIFLDEPEIINIFPSEISEGVYYNKYVVLSYILNNFEKGVIDLNKDGQINGNNTEFLKILRGQYDFPVKIKFDSEFNTGEYQVVSVESDSSAILVGDFYQEDNLKYSVIGNFTPGFIPSEENKFIYELDSYKIDLIDSNVLPVLNTGEEFILAIIKFNENGNIDDVTDERSNYIFNMENTSDLFVDDIASIIKIQRVENTKTIELFIEHGYKINSSSISIIENIAKLTILSGYCNYFGVSDPIFDNGFWDNWSLLNSENLKSCLITESINNVLTLKNFNNDIINVSGNYILIPNFKNIELKIILKNESEEADEYEIYKSFSIINFRNRFSINLIHESNVIQIKYRLFNDNLTTNWINLNNSYYLNINDVKTSSQNSSFVVNF